jgi:hypothetical protein
MALPLKGTLTSGSSGEVDIRIGDIKHIQIDAAGAGTLAITSLITGQSTFIAQTSITAETTILDLVDVNKIGLAASGGDVEYAVSLYSDS